MNFPDGLLEIVKNYLDITWEDAELDKKITGITLRGIAYLNDAADADFDFLAHGKPQELLLDYVRYVRSGALDEFQENYLAEIRMLQIGKGLGRYDEQTKQKSTNPDLQ